MEVLYIWQFSLRDMSSTSLLPPSVIRFDVLCPRCLQVLTVLACVSGEFETCFSITPALARLLSRTLGRRISLHCLLHLSRQARPERGVLALFSRLPQLLPGMHLCCTSTQLHPSALSSTLSSYLIHYYELWICEGAARAGCRSP